MTVRHVSSGPTRSDRGLPNSSRLPVRPGSGAPLARCPKAAGAETVIGPPGLGQSRPFGWSGPAGFKPLPAEAGLPAISKSRYHYSSLFFFGVNYFHNFHIFWKTYHYFQ